jgi:hypothetical protein
MRALHGVIVRLALAVILLGVTACSAGREGLIVQAYDTCDAYGFTPDTDAHAECTQREVLAAEQRTRARWNAAADSWEDAADAWDWGTTTNTTNCTTTGTPETGYSTTCW